MSQRIHQLPDQLIARIAAGEVVDRPASVLKELIENSLDAAATEISVAIEGAGRTRILVADNGCGMSRDDAHLAIKRHATSKISEFDDLEALQTFGFRGEALPSIAAVSRFRMLTRANEDESGWELIWEGGKLISEKPAPREPGTTIEVKNLFFNTPARFKFLKSDGTERAQCMRVVEEVAFHSLGVSFHIQLENLKSLIFKSHVLLTMEKKADVLKERAAAAWGSKWAQGFVPLHNEDKHFNIWGLVSHPDQHAPSPRNQVLFVNNRPVQNRRLTRAVYDAYVGQLFVGRHPSWILFLDVNPKSVDVNVHPSKREVKLAFENEIFGFLVTSIRRALQESSGSLISASASSQVLSQTALGRSLPFVPFRSPAGPGRIEAVETLYRPMESEARAGESPGLLTGWPVKNMALTAVAQMNRMFIVAESDGGLAIVDQHAAAEKVLYEKLMKNKESQSPQIQMLLVPMPWEVALSWAPLVRNNLALLKEFGFLLEPFGGETYLVKGYPSVLGEKFDLLTLLEGWVDVLSDSTDAKGGHERNFAHKIAAMTACKGSVRAGDPLDLKACQKLLDELVKLDAPHTCPHGRPTMVQMPYHELERRFRRI